MVIPGFEIIPFLQICEYDLAFLLLVLLLHQPVDESLKREGVHFDKAAGLHITTLIKTELFDRYFSRILSKGAEQLFC